MIELRLRISGRDRDDVTGWLYDEKCAHEFVQAPRPGDRFAYDADEHGGFGRSRIWTRYIFEVVHITHERTKSEYGKEAKPIMVAYLRFIVKGEL